ncbi:hypothetical protein O3M35_001969 [Rhynocoris fuscipes]|uniref:Uncharacterized protein n=1 Tax=Rhynocoris fuscipes TaxID=488301 RepID=A0AAW1CQT2_9HEMI
MVVQTLESLLQAFDEEDPDDAKHALNSPFIKHMDIEYARLARDLPLPKPTIPRAPAKDAAVRPNAAPSYVSPNQNKAQEAKDGDAAVGKKPEEEEEEFSLC